MKNFIYKNGDKMPYIGIGTWQSDPEKLYNAIIEAVKYGYRHIDCAHVYANETIVGEAIDYVIKSKLVTREELWVTSKLWNSCHKRSSAPAAIENTLKDLRLDYLNLYLIHWPVAMKEGVCFPESNDDMYSLKEVPLIETWRGMEDCFNAGLTRHIGVSNFSISKLDGIAKQASLPVETNQVELNPYLQQAELVDYCHSNGICVTAFTPLGKGNIARENDLNLFEDNIIKSIAAKHKCTISQVLLAWGIKKDIVVIPKSVTPSRIKENFDAINVMLDSDDMTRISTIDKDNRISYGGVFIMDGGAYTRASIWE